MTLARGHRSRSKVKVKQKEHRDDVRVVTIAQAHTSRSKVESQGQTRGTPSAGHDLSSSSSQLERQGSKVKSRAELTMK